MKKFIVKHDNQYCTYPVSDYALRALNWAFLLPEDQLRTFTKGNEEDILLLERSKEYRDPRWYESNKERTNAFSLIDNMIYYLSCGKDVIFDPNNLFVEPLICKNTND